MSSITINSNIASLNAQRRLGSSTRALQDTFTRLSSGLRINKASDDAAGLAIAESLKADQRVFNQGVRNLNDGVSLLSIADAALGELSGIAIRLAELAEQAANGALSNKQRGALNEEAQALKAEYFRISKTTEFNDVKLFAGELGDLRVQAGFGLEGGIVSGLGGAIGTGEFETQSTAILGGFSYSVISRDINGDGVLDLLSADFLGDTVNLFLGDGSGEFSAAGEISVGNGPRSIATGDFNGDGVFDIVSADRLDNSASVLLGDGVGGFSAANAFSVGSSPLSVATGDFNGDGALDIVTASSSDDTASVLLGDGSGGFGSANAFSVGNNPFSVVTGDFNGDGVLDIATADRADNTASVLIGDGSGGFSAASAFGVGGNPFSLVTGDFNGDGSLDIVTANYGDGTASLLLGDGNGNFGTATTLSVGNGPYSISAGDFNGDGALDIVTSNYGDGTATVLIGDGAGGFSAPIAYTVGSSPYSVSTGDFNGDGVLDIVAAGGLDDTAHILLGTKRDGVAPLLEFSLETQADARQTLPVFKQKIAQLAAQRGTIGAFEARLSTAINTARVATENFATARSQIEDADASVEAARLVKYQILQQAGASILAQANQGPALALTLLGGG